MQRTSAGGTTARQVPVLVVGAGLTGLSAALALQQQGVACRVLERASRVGGLVVTVEEHGYRFDRTGHLLHLRDDGLRAQVLDWLDEEPLVIQRRSAVWYQGRYTRYPFQSNAAGLAPDVAYECVLGFVRAQSTNADAQPANFEEFCQAHFGDGITRHFMVPYNRRLWGVNPDQITAAWCDRFVPIPKLEDVIAGAVGKRRAELGYNAEFLYPRQGIGALTDAMARRLPRVQLAVAPERIDGRRRRVTIAGTPVSYQVLINTAPLPVLLGLLVDLPGSIRQAASMLRWTELYYLDVALDGPCLKDYNWIYVPEDRYPFYRVGAYSSFSPCMAPAGKAGLYVELAERRSPNEDRLLPEVVRGLVEMGLIRGPQDIRFIRVRHLPHAYVVYDHNYEQATTAILQFLQECGIVSTGRYGGWNYSSMEDALAFGRGAAARCLRSL